MTKTVNYTDEMVKTITEGYTGTDNKAEVPILATAINRSEASVRSKLGNMGLYIKDEKPATSKAGTKAEVVAAIAEVINLTEVEREGLAKATAVPLNAILAALTTAAAEVE